MLEQTTQIDRATDEAWGRNMDTVHQGLKRDYVSKQAKNRARLGVPPEWGAPVMMPPQDKSGQFLASLQTGLSIASSVMTLGTTEIAKVATGALTKTGDPVMGSRTLFNWSGR